MPSSPSGASALAASWCLPVREAMGVEASSPPAPCPTATPCVAATATLNLALPKRGLLAAPEVGELYLADISVPRFVYRRMGIDVADLFAEEGLV